MTTMSNRFDAIEAQALLLSPEERAKLADHLLASIGSGEEVDQAWADEVQRRLAQVEAGEVDLIPAEQAVEQLRQSLS